MTISPDGKRFTDLTTAANQQENERLEPISQEPVTVAATPPPFVSARLAAVAGVAAFLLPLGSAFLPPPFGAIALILGFVAAYLAGQPLQVPAFLEGKPLVGKAAVPLLGTLATSAGVLADGMPVGPAKVGIIVGGLLLAVLAGKAAPVPKQ